ncbi:MAG: 16S rRNA (cytidine(1402)-2'-O)-methyltransferase [Bacteroidia bacterium]
MQAGTLYLIPTPIGNLDDITLRAINTLKHVDLILAEDTRQTLKLTQHFQINTPLQSYHQHNEHQVTEKIITLLQNGKYIAVVSDAGTPGISDPGFLLVRACVKNNITVNCLPGPTAFVPALVKSGIPCNSFTFLGFLPDKKGRSTLLNFISNNNLTTVFYESPHKIIKTLEQLIQYCGEERLVSVSREISKMFEETITDNLLNVLNHFLNKPIKGEFVIVVEPKK